MSQVTKERSAMERMGPKVMSLKEATSQLNLEGKQSTFKSKKKVASRETTKKLDFGNFCLKKKVKANLYLEGVGILPNGKVQILGRDFNLYTANLAQLKLNQEEEPSLMSEELTEEDEEEDEVEIISPEAKLQSLGQASLQNLENGTMTTLDNIEEEEKIIFESKNLKEIDPELFGEGFKSITDCIFWMDEEIGTETKDSNWVEKNLLVMGSDEGTLCVIDLNVKFRK